jgi:hypothetical protein
MGSGRLTKKGTSQPKVERKSGGNIRKERQPGPRWLLHCSHSRQGTSGKFTEKEKLQTKAERGLEENVNKEDMGWTYDSRCSLLYCG